MCAQVGSHLDSSLITYTVCCKGSPGACAVSGEERPSTAACVGRAAHVKGPLPACQRNLAP